MKKTSLIILILSALALYSCQQDGEKIFPEETVDLNSEATLESAFEDLDQITEAGVEDISFETSRRERDRLLDCAIVAHDTATNTIVIDYGDGCEGPNGRIRSGKITINYDGRKYEPGSYRVVTTEDFYIDSVKIEGVRTITNISESTEDIPTFNIKLEGGKAIFPDGTFATRDADHTRTWYRARVPYEDYATLDGSASGITREGTDYSSTITETLIFKRSCARVFVSVQGIKVLTVGDSEVIIDFGDGTCDALVEITKDGETTEEEIRLRGRGIK